MSTTEIRITDVPPSFARLADLIGEFIQYWGFKKIHGQIWTHIWLAKVPIDSTTLVLRLKVSKAQVSLAIKDLIQYDVIRIVTEGDRRKSMLIPNPDLYSVISNVLQTRETVMMESIQKTQNEVAKMSSNKLEAFNLDLQKLEAMIQMTSIADFALKSLVASNLDILSTFNLNSEN